MKKIIVIGAIIGLVAIIALQFIPVKRTVKMTSNLVPGYEKILTENVLHETIIEEAWAD